MKAIRTYRARSEADFAKRVLDDAAVLSLVIPDTVSRYVYLFVPEELASHAGDVLEQAERTKAA